MKQVMMRSQIRDQRKVQKDVQPDFILITLYETSKNMVSFRGLSCKNLYKSKQGAYMAQQIAISSTSHSLCAVLAQVPGAEWLN